MPTPKAWGSLPKRGEKSLTVSGIGVCCEIVSARNIRKPN